MDHDVEVLSQHGVSTETATLIKHKQDIEMDVKERNEKMQEQVSHIRMIDEHIRVAEGIRSLFINRDKKGMWQTEVIESLQSNPLGHFSSNSELIQTIVNISKILPDWIKIFNIPRGVFLRMDRDRVPILKIRECIQKYFEKQANKSD